MLEADLEAGCDAVDVGLQQLVAELPRGLAQGPGHAGLFVGAHEHPAAFLPKVELAVEIDRVDDLLAGPRVDLGDLGHVLGQQVHVFHGEHGQFEADHPPDLPGPEAAGVDDVLASHVALVGVDGPAAGAAGDGGDLRMRLDGSAEPLGGLCIGIGDAGRVEMAVHRRFDTADEFRRVEQGHQLVGALGGDDLGVDALDPALRDGALEPVEAVCGGGQEDAAGHVEAGGVARQLLDFAIEIDGVFLEFGDVRIAVDRVAPARRVPGGAGGQLGSFQQQHVGPAALGEVVEDRTPDDAAADDHNPCRIAHRPFSRSCRGSGYRPCSASRATLRQGRVAFRPGEGGIWRGVRASIGCVNELFTASVLRPGGSHGSKDAAWDGTDGRRFLSGREWIGAASASCGRRAPTRRS